MRIMHAAIDDVSHALSQMQQSREAADLTGFCLAWGLALGSLLRVGYHPQSQPVRIAPDDRWRQALQAEITRGLAAFPELDLAHVRLGRMHRYLLPPD